MNREEEGSFFQRWTWSRYLNTPSSLFPKRLPKNRGHPNLPKVEYRKDRENKGEAFRLERTEPKPSEKIFIPSSKPNIHQMDLPWETKLTMKTLNLNNRHLQSSKYNSQQIETRLRRPREKLRLPESTLERENKTRKNLWRNNCSTLLLWTIFIFCWWTMIQIGKIHRNDFWCHSIDWNEQTNKHRHTKRNKSAHLETSQLQTNADSEQQTHKNAFNDVETLKTNLDLVLRNRWTWRRERKKWDETHNLQQIYTPSPFWGSSESNGATGASFSGLASTSCGAAAFIRFADWPPLLCCLG